MSILKNSRSAREIEAQLNETLRNMVDYQSKGSYMEAEECRVLADKLKKDYEERRILELHQRHEQEEADLIRNYENELRDLIIHWEKTIEEHNNEGELLVNEMEFRHTSELEAKREEL